MSPLIFFAQILNDYAYWEAITPAHRSKGLTVAIGLARQVRALVGDDRILNDPFVSSLRDQWLKYPDNLTDTLYPSQAELHNNLIMLFFDEAAPRMLGTSADATETMVAEIREELGFDDVDGMDSLPARGRELWERYQTAVELADKALQNYGFAQWEYIR